MLKGDFPLIQAEDSDYSIENKVVKIITFRMGSNLKFQLVKKYIQLIIKFLFTTQGSDPFNPEYGGNLLKFKAEHQWIDEHDQAMVYSFIKDSVERCKNYLLALEQIDQIYPVDLILMGVEVDKSKVSCFIKIVWNTNEETVIGFAL